MESKHAKEYSRFLAKTNVNFKCPSFHYQVLRSESMVMPSAGVDEWMFSPNVDRLFTFFWRSLSSMYPNTLCASFDGVIPLREIYPEKVIIEV